jgi:hypothetical protein
MQIHIKGRGNFWGINWEAKDRGVHNAVRKANRRESMSYRNKVKGKRYSDSILIKLYHAMGAEIEEDLREADRAILRRIQRHSDKV